MVYTAEGPGAGAEWSTNGTTWTEIPHVRKWEANVKEPSKGYRSSSTGGKMRRVSGGEEADGSVEVFDDDANPFDLGSLGIVKGAAGYLRLRLKTGRFLVIQSYIPEVSYGVDIEGQDFVGSVISFESDGDITLPTA